MTERKPHPDNALIDELTEDSTPDQGSRAGGNVNRDVGTRAELNSALRESGIERATGKDNPKDDEMKGEKTIERLDPAKRGPR